MIFSSRRYFGTAFVLASVFLTGCKLTVDVGGQGQGVVQSVSGNIDCGTQCNLETEVDQLEILSATASEGSKFAGWSGDCTGLGACKVTVGKYTGNVNVTAMFEPLATMPLRAATFPSEFVGTTVEVVINDLQDFMDIADPLFGDAARDGGHLMPTEIEPGIRISSAPSTSNPDQLIVTADMTVTRDATPAIRTMMMVPVSYNTGKLFIEAVRVAMTNMAQVEMEEPIEVRPYHIEYRSNSAMGGRFRIGVKYDTNETVLLYSIESPTVSLFDDQVNMPALSGRPYETIFGEVNFTLTRDQFTFFSSRAYGFSAGKGQNFDDFLLLPHDWLRLNIEPKLAERKIEVGFEVVTLDGDRVAIASAPASAVAGDQFIETVLRRVDNMNAAEASEPGSSRAWEVPFVYADANTGGAVTVLAQSQNGEFAIAYAVESPLTYLDDVEFVPYQGDIVIPDDWDEEAAECETLTAAQSSGQFEVTFFASKTVRNSRDLDGPLRGNIWGEVFRSEDVILTGPLPGVTAVAEFAYTDVDISSADGSPQTYLIDTPLPAGAYQILGFIDIDNNGADTTNPDKGDPVTMPIGQYDMTCITQPTNVEFAILNPSD